MHERRGNEHQKKCCFCLAKMLHQGEIHRSVREENENPDRVIEAMRKLHPRSLNKNVGKVRLQWVP